MDIFGGNLAALGVSNAIQGGLLPKLLGRGGISGRLAAAGGELGMQSLEEGVQEGIQNKAAGLPYSFNPVEVATNPELQSQRDAMKAGLLDLSPLVLGGAVVGGVRGRYSNKKANEFLNDSSNDDPDFTEKQNQMSRLAQYASARAKEKYGYDIPPELLYKQWANEAGANFDSPLAKSSNNYGGLTQVEDNGDKQPDGNNYYRKFKTDRDFADAYVDDFIKHYPKINGVKNEQDFANILHSYGYFTATPEEYAATMRGVKVPKNIGNNIRNDEFVDDTAAQTDESPAGIYEGKYWQKQFDGVSWDGAKPDTMRALDMLGKKTGKPLVVTAVTNGQHAEGERGHHAGWKFDVNDYGSGAEGSLTTDDFQKGYLADEFIKYGQSLGLGMNFEGAGTDNVHFDVSVLGDQWEGEYAGKNFGGFKSKSNSSKADSSKSDSSNVSSQNPAVERHNSVIDGIIENLLTAEPDVVPVFDARKNRDLEKNVYSLFVENSKSNSDFLKFLQDSHMLNKKGDFVNNDNNRILIRKNFEEELNEFADNKINERLEFYRQNQLSYDDKIRSNFENFVQREEADGKPVSVKHR